MFGSTHSYFCLSFHSENREQLAAAGVLDSLSYSAKVAIPPHRPHLQRSQSHSVAHSSPPSPSPNGYPLPPLRAAAAPSKYFGTSSPSAFHRHSPPSPSGFSHPSSYQAENGFKRSMHQHSNSTDQVPVHGRHYSQGGHQQHHSDHGHHEMSSSLPSHFHMHPSQSRPMRWEPQGPNGQNKGRTMSGSPKPEAEPMDVTMSSSLPSLPSVGSVYQQQPALSFAHHSASPASQRHAVPPSHHHQQQHPHVQQHHRHQHSQDYGTSPLSTSSPANESHGYEHGRGYSENHGHDPRHQHSHSSSFSQSSASSPGSYSQSFPNYSHMHHHPQHHSHGGSPAPQHSPQSGHHHYSSSPSSSSYFQSHGGAQGSQPPYQQQHSNGHHASSSLDDRRFHSAPIPVRNRP